MSTSNVQQTTMRGLVDEVLNSPEFRAGLNSALQNNPDIASTLRTPPPFGSPRLPFASVQQEIRSLFPSVSHGSHTGTSSINGTTVRPTTSNEKYHQRSSKRKKMYKEAYSSFTRDIIILRSPTECKTLKGKKKTIAYKKGYVICAVKMEKRWSDVELHNYLKDIVKEKMPSMSAEFVLLLPMGGSLVQPSLAPGEYLNGLNVSRIFLNKPIYVRPLTNITAETELEESNESTLYISDSEDDGLPQFLRSSTDLCQTSSSSAAMPGIVSDSLVGDAEYEHIEDVALDHDTLIALEESMKDNGTIHEANVHSSVHSLLQELNAKIDKENISIFNVNREDVIACCLRAVQRKTFSPLNKLSVMFTDMDGAHNEGAIDNGGPTREMLRLLMQALKASYLFEGEENAKYLALNSDALEDHMYYEAGRFIALSLVHGGPGPKFLSNSLFTMIAKGQTALTPTIIDVSDYEVRDQISQILNANDEESLCNALGKAETLLSLCGCPPNVTLEKKDSVGAAMLNFYVLNRPRAALDQFIEGLETLGIFTSIKKYPQLFEDVFCYKEEKLTAAMMKDLFRVSYCEVGSNKRAVESRVVGFWWDYLYDCEENEAEASLKEVLTFATGSDCHPPLGFPFSPVLEFLHDSDCKFPKANTCSLAMQLPVCHLKYADFKKEMSYGILNGMVFGFQ